MGLCFPKSTTLRNAEAVEIKQSCKFSYKAEQNIWKSKALNAPKLTLDSNRLYKRRLLQMERNAQALYIACDNSTINSTSTQIGEAN
ncbi:unnamed protein product [Blepharisma stoltei]|uniref:Uncharacterized protein n=1 Tax=Blepharisma stoltei TaxID=1481888 RepID=A0AAU9KEV5_9CILI|nr:unnamed protein product [Blepharisma stoltei]